MHFPEVSVRFSLIFQASVLMACLLAPINAFAAQPIFGPEFQINEVTAGAQTRPEITANGNNRVLVAWESRPTEDPLDATIVAREFVAGTPTVFPELTVASTTDSELFMPSIAYSLSGTNALITWFEVSETTRAVQSRLVDSSGSLGSTLELASNPLLGWFPSRVIPRPDDEFIVGWGDGQIPGNGLIARTVTSDPFHVIGESLLGLRAAHEETAFYVSSLGTTVTLYTDLSTFGIGDPGFSSSVESYVGLWPSIYDERDTVTASSTKVHEQPTIGPIGEDGEMIVAWIERNDSIGAIRLDSNGVRILFAITVEDPNEQAAIRTNSGPKTAPGAGGSVAIVWTDADDGDGQGIRGRIYDGELNPITDPFQINEYTTGDQNYPDITTLGDGSFMVTWQSVGSPASDNDGESILGRRIWSPLLFADGFEDGTLDAWSESTP